MLELDDVTDLDREKLVLDAENLTKTWCVKGEIVYFSYSWH